MPTNIHIVKAMVFPVVMWEVNQKEGWMLKNWCFWIAVLEKTLVSPLDSKEIKPVISKGNQPWIFIGRTGAKTESPWPPDGMSWLIRKDLMLGKLQGKRRGQQRIIWLNSMWLNGHEFEQTLRDSEGQGSLVCHRKPMGSQRVGHDLATEQQQQQHMLQGCGEKGTLVHWRADCKLVQPLGRQCGGSSKN